jgi:hypothetical protein
MMCYNAINTNWKRNSSHYLFMSIITSVRHII